MADRALRRISGAQSARWLLPHAAATLRGLTVAGLVLLGVATLSALSFFGYLYVAGLLLAASLFLPFSSDLRARGYSPVGFALLILWGQVSLAGFVAPFLALAYALLDSLHLPEPLLPLFGMYGVTLMAWVRAVAALAGIGMSLAYVFLDAKWRLEQLRQIRNLPRSKTRSAAIGLAEFEGVARAVHSGPRSAGERFESQRILPGESAQPLLRFFLEDETGRIPVDPTGARLRTGTAFHLSGQLCEIHLGNAAKPSARKGELWDGDPLYLIGNVQIDSDAPPDSSGSGGVVVRPLAVPHYSGPLWRLLFGKDPPGQQRKAPNVFFASDSREHGARQAIVSGLRQSVLFALIWIVASGWLLNRELQRFGQREYWQPEAVVPEPVDPREERARLVKALRSANAFDRSAALNGLWGRRGEFEHDSSCCPELAPALVATLEHKDRHVRDFAEFALATMRYERTRIVPQIVRAFGSPDPGVRQSVVETLGRIKSEPEVALPALLAALEDPERPVQHAACHALAEYGEAMALAFRCLKERLTDPDEEVRHEAVSHLSRIQLDPVFALPLWSGLLNGRDTTFTYFAAIGLIHLGREAKPALPQLIEALRNKRHNGRVFVVRTLGMLGADAAPAVPDLIAALEEHRTEVQHDAVIALRAIGPAAAEALPALRRLQREAYDASVRNYAALAVRDIERQ
jgi:HEAT repeat protein